MSDKPVVLIIDDVGKSRLLGHLSSALRDFEVSFGRPPAEVVMGPEFERTLLEEMEQAWKKVATSMVVPNYLLIEWPEGWPPVIRRTHRWRGKRFNTNQLMEL